MLIVTFRPDHAYRLIAIPYQTQASRPGDNIVYRYLDVNLDRLVKYSQGNNIIQCAISFENKKAPDCTHVMKGMHHQCSEWYDRLLMRHVYKGHEYVSLFQINPAHYNRQDVTHFGIFETVPVL
jgi:hypothetical protein